VAGLRIVWLQCLEGQLLLTEVLGVNPLPSTSFSFSSIDIRARMVGPTPFSLAISLSRSTVSGSSLMV